MACFCFLGYCLLIFAYDLNLWAEGQALRSLEITERCIDSVRTKGYSTDLLDPTQVESKKCSQIQWPVPSINAEPVDIFLGEE